MGYYRGDYYRGDYYRGDPFLGALIGGAVKKIAPKVGRWVKGRVLGSTKKVVTAIAQRTTIPEVVRDVGVGALGYKLGQESMPGLGPLDMGEQLPAPQGGGNVAVFISRDGRRIRKRWSVSQQRWIAIRKLNPLNPRALKRGLRRAEGFAKFAKRTMNGLYKPGSVRKFKSKIPASRS